MSKTPSSVRLRAALSNGGARDVLAAYEGLKAARIAVHATLLQEVSDLLIDMGLIFEMSPEVTYPRRDSGKGGWSNQFAGPEGGDPHRVLYVANSLSLSQAAAEAEALGDDAQLGRLLAIPECCQVFYGECAEAAALEQGDLLPFFAPLTYQRVNPLLNLGAQYFDMAFLSHFPCSCECAASIRLAERQAEVVRYYDAEWASTTLQFLHRVCVYTEEEGVFLLTCVAKQGNEIAYANRNIHGTALGRVNDELATNSVLRFGPGAAITLSSEHGAETVLSARNLRVLVPTP